MSEYNRKKILSKNGLRKEQMKKDYEWENEVAKGLENEEERQDQWTQLSKMCIIKTDK